MKNYCMSFKCAKFGKECNACSTTGKTKGALCAPTCDFCKNKETCWLPKDLNKREAER